ncbi:MAG: aspartate ammonia-lyase [Gammaproteobacteria bacterium]|jgi:aspartate ammonia-lyase
MKPSRTEIDSLGELSIPADALYGINTARALNNFPINGRKLGDEAALVRAFGYLKKAAALANRDLGVLTAQTADSISRACDELISGRLNHHLVVPLLEGSGGTSTNMNINEVLANRAQVFTGHPVGSFRVIHPNDHVNSGQSTNDVMPSAMKLACYHLCSGLVEALKELVQSLSVKVDEFSDVYRLGRTCLQDAQPMTLGQAFSGYAAVLNRSLERVQLQQARLLTIPLGGTAIGTGLGSVKGYRSKVFKHLNELTGLSIEPASNRFDGMQNLDEFQRLSAELEIASAAMAKIAKDLILLSSGPSGGLGEIQLPAVQAGSSIMPGKVNPVIPMSVVQLSQMLHGNHSCIAMACQDGMLEINHYEQVVADRLFDSLHRFTEITTSFSRLCIRGICADRDRSLDNLRRSFALATTLVPKLGYTAVSQLVKESVKQKVPFLDLVQQRKLMSAEEIDELIISVVDADL